MRYLSDLPIKGIAPVEPGIKADYSKLDLLPKDVPGNFANEFKQTEIKKILTKLSGDFPASYQEPGRHLRKPANAALPLLPTWRAGRSRWLLGSWMA